MSVRRPSFAVHARHGPCDRHTHDKEELFSLWLAGCIWLERPNKRIVLTAGASPLSHWSECLRQAPDCTRIGAPCGEGTRRLRDVLQHSSVPLYACFWLVQRRIAITLHRAPPKAAGLTVQNRHRFAKCGANCCSRSCSRLIEESSAGCYSI